VWVIAVIMGLDQIGLDITPIIAGAGIAGLAVGFGAQNLVRDVINGFFIILENQIRIGDVAIVNGTGGLVEAITYRTITLRDLHGTVHIFPNGTVTTLSNMTTGWSGCVLDIGVAYKEDTDKVAAVMRAGRSGITAGSGPWPQNSGADGNHGCGPVRRIRSHRERTIENRAHSAMDGGT
jgi:moderate conductance mechanosensitive channel